MSTVLRHLMYSVWVFFFLTIFFTLVATTILREILEKAPHVTWSQLSECKLALCNLARCVLLQGSSKARSQRGDSVGSDSGLSVCTVNSSQDQSGPNRPLSAGAHLRATSPLRWADLVTWGVSVPSRSVDSEQWNLSVTFKEENRSGSYCVVRLSNTSSPHLKHWCRYLRFQ